MGDRRPCQKADATWTYGIWSECVQWRRKEIGKKEGRNKPMAFFEEEECHPQSSNEAIFPVSHGARTLGHGGIGGKGTLCFC